MTRFLVWLKTEPAVVIQLFQAILGILVSLGVLGFTDLQTGGVLAVIAAVLGVIQGLATRPFQVPLIVGVAQAVILAVSEFGFDVSETVAANIYIVITVLGAVLTRQNATPETKLSPLPGAPPASAVRGV